MNGRPTWLMMQLPRNGSLVGILVVEASPESGPVCTDEYMDRIFTIANIYIQTIKVIRYALRDGEAGVVVINVVSLPVYS